MPLDRVRIVAGDTTCSPNELYTSGSQSVEIGGSAVRIVCAAVRRLLVDAAARRFEVAANELRTRDGAVEMPGTDLRADILALRRASIWHARSA